MPGPDLSLLTRSDLSNSTNCGQIMAMLVTNEVTAKIPAKLKLLFNKLATALLRIPIDNKLCLSFFVMNHNSVLATDRLLYVDL